jgi:alpha-beta hydrolase superfamily lysophospholipase
LVHFHAAADNHEVFNEPEHEKVLKDVEMWLEKRFTGKIEE